MSIIDLLKNQNKIIAKDDLQKHSDQEEVVTLRQMIVAILSNLDLEKVSQKIVDLMVDNLGAQGGILFLLDEDKKYCYSYTASNTFIIRQIIKTLKVPLREHKFYLDKKENYIQRSIMEKKIFTGNKFEDFISPIIEKRLAHWMQIFSSSRSSIVLPVLIRDEVIGALWINFPFENVSKEIEYRVKIFADITAVAIINASQYKQIHLQYQNLQGKTQDLASLLDISAIAASSLETLNITQKIVDSVPEKLGHLGYIGGFLAMYNSKTTELRAYSITESALIQTSIKKLLDKPFANYRVFANQDHNLIIDAINTGEMRISDNAYEFVSPPVNKNIVITIQKLTGMKSCAVLPIFIRGEIIGTFMFMIKKPPAEIGERDIVLMKAFVNHISISIDNSMLFDRTTKQIAELEHTRANLEEILTMKNDFLHIVSHQLRTPLTAVRGLISMWRDGDFDHYTADKMKAVKDRVSSNADRLNNIINDMIVAMESEGELKLVFGPTDIEKLIRENIEILKSNYEKKGLYLKYSRISENIPEIEADAKYLIHVFMNIIDNAEKYTERGGLEITLHREGDNVYIRFTDTGAGISEEDQKILFQKFSRGKKSSLINPNGSGLGLYIAKQIIDEHNGNIQASSLGEGRGATFVVTLPVKQPVLADRQQ